MFGVETSPLPCVTGQAAASHHTAPVVDALGLKLAPLVTPGMRRGDGPPCPRSRWGHLLSPRQGPRWHLRDLAKRLSAGGLWDPLLMDPQGGRRWPSPHRPPQWEGCGAGRAGQQHPGAVLARGVLGAVVVPRCGGVGVCLEPLGQAAERGEARWGQAEGLGMGKSTGALGERACGENLPCPELAEEEVGGGGEALGSLAVACWSALGCVTLRSSWRGSREGLKWVTNASTEAIAHKPGAPHPVVSSAAAAARGGQALDTITGSPSLSTATVSSWQSPGARSPVKPHHATPRWVTPPHQRGSGSAVPGSVVLVELERCCVGPYSILNEAAFPPQSPVLVLVADTHWLCRVLLPPNGMQCFPAHPSPSPPLQPPFPATSAWRILLLPVLLRAGFFLLASPGLVPPAPCLLLPHAACTHTPADKPHVAPSPPVQPPPNPQIWITQGSPVCTTGH